MRKYFSKTVTAAITIAVLALTQTATAQNAGANGGPWNVGAASNPGGAAAVTATLADSVLTIRGTGAMQNFTFYQNANGINSPWTSYRNGIARLVIEEGVTTIGDYSFHTFENLRTAVIPASVTDVGQWAFGYCTKLTTMLFLPTTTPSFGASVFSGGTAGALTKLYCLSSDGWTGLNLNSGTIEVITKPTSAFTATFGQTLADVTPALGAGWSWNTPTAAVGNAGTQTHSVKFALSGITDPAFLSFDVQVTVNKATTGLSADPATYRVNIKPSQRGVPQTYDLSNITFNKTDYGEILSYTSTGYSSGGKLAAQPTIEGSIVTYTFLETAEIGGQVPSLTISIASENYYPITATVFFGIATVSVTFVGLEAKDEVYDGTVKKGFSGTPTDFSGDLSELTYMYYQYKDKSLGLVADNIITLESAPANSGDYLLFMLVPASNIDYTGSKQINFSITKATAAAPTGLTATVGQTLADVSLAAHTGWAWATPTTAISAAGAQTYKANFTPTDTNYIALTNVDVSVQVVADPSPTRHPQIAIGSIRVQTDAKAIILENIPKNAKVEVYSLQGKQIYSNTSHSPTSHLKIEIQTKGIYVLKAGSQTVRVIVK